MVNRSQIWGREVQSFGQYAVVVSLEHKMLRKLSWNRKIQEMGVYVYTFARICGVVF